ncbi:EAL domain-containing protein [Photobacterium sanguinicancri]|uniref:EAL domain-containing protein n=1 Tax=Photobacterium sanguinicancri TaxID=875932 RepID=A0AAW7Y5E3_9GAMM|nr:EAL domain-containing protein [Photobacterium sanguinicancri]MDO6541825.1 EAL domain-containing protein [Photobacterium sanguinicancri]
MLSLLITRLSNNRIAIALCNVFIMALPISLLATFCNLLEIFAFRMEWLSFAETIGNVGRLTAHIFPILINIYMAMYLSDTHRLPKSATIACSLVAFFIVSYQWTFISTVIPLPNSFAVALLSAFMTSTLISIINRTKLMHVDLSSSVVDNSLKVLACYILSLTSIVLVSSFIKVMIMPTFSLYNWFPVLNPLDFTDAMIYEFIRSILWSFGINGHNVLHTYKSELYDITVANIEAWRNSGDALNIISANFYDFFTGMGGSGNTFSLVVCMLLFAKNRGYKTLAKAVFILALFNINEPLLFGIPIIFNPIMLVPFILVPQVSLVIAYFSFWIGWVEPINEVNSWLLPPLLSGYLSTGGTAGGVILQIVILVVGVAMYYPFFKIMDTRSEGIDVTRIFNRRFFVNSDMAVKSKLASFIPSMQSNLQAQRNVERLNAEGEMILYYQPQVDVKNGQIVGMEALLRYRTHNGDILPPTFIQSFSQLQMMPELDYWVIEQAIQATSPYSSRPGFLLSINVSSDTILTKGFVKYLDKLIIGSSLKYEQIEIEITEELLVSDEVMTAEVINQLRTLGVSVALDDFGTGFSSLAYLSRYDFDKIKVDRSLIQKLDTARGKELLRIVVELGKVTNAKLVVEGVETHEELQYISSLGVRYVQGFYYYKAMPLDNIVTLMDAERVVV